MGRTIYYCPKCEQEALEGVAHVCEPPVRVQRRGSAAGYGIEIHILSRHVAMMMAAMLCGVLDGWTSAAAGIIAILLLVNMATEQPPNS